MTFLGMDPAEIQRVAGGMKGQAEVLHRVLTHVDTLVSHAAHVWPGPDSEGFRDAWYGSHRGAVQGTVHELTTRVAWLYEQIGQQEDISGGGLSGMIPGHNWGSPDPALPGGPRGIGDLPNLPGFTMPAPIRFGQDEGHNGFGGGAYEVNQGSSLTADKDGLHGGADAGFTVGEVHGHHSTDLPGGLRHDLDGKAEVGGYGADAGFDAGKDGLDAHVGAHANSVHLHGSGSLHGPLGITDTTTADGAVGADADAGAHLGPGGGSVHGQAMIGAHGSIERTVGVDEGHVSAKAEGIVGVGVKGDANASFDHGKLKFGAHGGAALGIGGSIGFNAEVDVNKISRHAHNVSNSVGRMLGGIHL